MTKTPISLPYIWGKLWGKRKLFYIIVPLTFVLSCALILCVPRTYVSGVVLAPETQNGASSLSGLSSLASSFGINLGSMANKDAIHPTIYPDVVGSKRFLMSLLTVPVTTTEGETMTYQEFLKQQKYPFWQIPRRWVMQQISAHRKKDAVAVQGENGTIISIDYDTYKMLDNMSDNISCVVDMKTDMISIDVQAQDAMVAALMADTVRVRLQRLITDYRTQKARNDMEYYHQQAQDAYQEYMDASEEYIRRADANGDVRRSRESVELARLEEAMTNAEGIYTTFYNQYMAAQAKMQECTPAFTIIDQAFVPNKPAKPKRVIFVLMMTMLAIIGTGSWVMRKEIIEWF